MIDMIAEVTTKPGILHEVWTDVGQYVAAAGGIAAVLGRAKHVYDAVVHEGGVWNVIKAFLVGSARVTPTKPDVGGSGTTGAPVV